MRRPRLLYLGHNLPYPPHEGALIRSYHTVRLLSEHFDVTGVYFYRRGAHPSGEDRQRASDELGRFGTVEIHPIPQEYSRLRLLTDHARSVLAQQPYTRWMHASSEARRTVADVVASGRVDLVHVDSLDLVHYLPLMDSLPVVLAHHNVESALLRRRAEPENGLLRAYIRHQADLVERAERKWANVVSLNVAVSEGDAALLRRIAPEAEVLVVPNGVDTTEFVPGEADTQGGIVFVGGYSWFPNTDGMEFFAREILPVIRERHPLVPVRWIGKAPDEAMRRFGELGIEMLGYVDDIRPIVRASRCAIVPLRVGGGTRLKILDAWSMGKAVVSTSVGCEGLMTRHGTNILIADHPADFADAVSRVLDDSALRQRLESEARSTAVEHYDWATLGEVMGARYQQLLPLRQ